MDDNTAILHSSLSHLHVPHNPFEAASVFGSKLEVTLAKEPRGVLLAMLRWLDMPIPARRDHAYLAKLIATHPAIVKAIRASR